jgi:hypothetical protein
MSMRMKRNQYSMSKMDQHRLCRTEGIVGDVVGYGSEHVHNVDAYADKEEKTSQAHDGSTQNVED